MRFVAVIFIILSNTFVLIGQNAPITSAATMNNPAPGTIIVPVTVTDFQNIGAISLSLDYNYAVLNFVKGTQNPSIPGWFAINDNNLGNGFHRLIMGWYGSGVSLPDGSSIMDIEFTYIAGTTRLSWFDNGGSCEYTDINYLVLNDTPAADYYINGAVCGSIGTAGPISGDSSICRGTSAVFYSTDTIPNATGYVWSVPAAAAIISGQNTNAITVDYSDTAVSGLITVSGINPCDTGASSQVGISVHILPIANAGNDTLIPYGTNTMLHAASGGSGSYSYYWTPAELLEDPFLQNPQTVLLTASDYFSVEVTDDSSSCQNTDYMLLTIAGGPLSANPSAIPDELCFGDSARLFSNAGGGSGNYTYLWSANPADQSLNGQETMDSPLVSPQMSTVYSVEVFDGFTTTSGDVELTVHDLPTAYISGGDILCGENDSTILSTDLTGTANWSVIYSNGFSTFRRTNIHASPYLFYVSDSGTYVILEVDDANCSGTSSGYALIEKYQIPETPAITQLGNELSSDITNGNQWYLNNTAIDGATEAVYTATVDGQYFDIVNINSCMSDTSNLLDVVITRIGEMNRGGFLIIPNPTDNKFLIRSASFISEKLKVKLFSITGNLISSYNLKMEDGFQSDAIDVGDLRPGLYIIHISNKNRNETFKLIIQ